VARQAAGQNRVIVDLIGATPTGRGQKVHCELDPNTSLKGIAVSDQDMAATTIAGADFHGDWNDPIKPLTPSERAVDSCQRLSKIHGRRRRSRSCHSGSIFIKL
jgi:hypothetical protein